MDKSELLQDYEQLKTKSRLCQSQNFVRSPLAKSNYLFSENSNRRYDDTLEQRVAALENKIVQLEQNEKLDIIMGQFGQLKMYVESKLNELDKKI